MLMQNLNMLQKRVVLYNMYIKDGADPETASDAAEHCRSPMKELRKCFDCDENTEIQTEQLTAS